VGKAGQVPELIKVNLRSNCNLLLLGFPEKDCFQLTLLDYTNEHVNLRQESFAVLLNFRKKLVFNNLLLLGD